MFQDHWVANGKDPAIGVVDVATLFVGSTPCGKTSSLLKPGPRPWLLFLFLLLSLLLLLLLLLRLVLVASATAAASAAAAADIHQCC